MFAAIKFRDFALLAKSVKMLDACQ